MHVLCSWRSLELKLSNKQKSKDRIKLAYFLLHNNHLVKAMHEGTHSLHAARQMAQYWQVETNLSNENKNTTTEMARENYWKWKKTYYALICWNLDAQPQEPIIGSWQPPGKGGILTSRLFIRQKTVRLMGDLRSRKPQLRCVSPQALPS